MSGITTSEPQATQLSDFLSGGGEMGQLMRSVDWSRTAVGPVMNWPQSLRTSISICLDSRFPILIWWGPDLLMFYNDAYRSILGSAKHPRALGAPGREIWPEIWHIISPMLEGVLERGEATYSQDLLLMLERNGFPEECYFTFSYSPIRSESDRRGGIFTAVTETTGRVVGERRLRTLSELAAHSTGAKTAEEACLAVGDTLDSNEFDIPFWMIYLLSEDGSHTRLCASGAKPNSPGAPDFLSTDGSEPWPIGECVRSNKPIVFDRVAETFGAMPRGPWPRSPERAVVLPISSSTQDAVPGVVIIGASSARSLDDEYLNFLELVVGHISTAIANAMAQEEERRRLEALQELDRAKTAFFSNVSHEFRTPLTLMLGNLEATLSESHLNAADKERLESAQRNSHRLLRLVNSLLDFSRVEAGRVSAEYRLTDLSRFTKELASGFRSATERAGLRLIVDCETVKRPTFVDREMWEKIVLNLLSNAFKYTLAGEISVNLRELEDRVELSVRDTGVGIPSEELPNLFKRFHRIEGQRGRTHEGSGIGLALVQELVRLHGGTIHVSSTLSQGSTFNVRLPLGDAHLPREQLRSDRENLHEAMAAGAYVEEALRWLPDHGGIGTDTVDEVPAESGGMVGRFAATRDARIILADDNADMRQYVSRLLRPHFHVEAVCDGEAALDAARRQQPDLVLSDVMMPKLDGFGLVRELRADPKLASVPVILLSARAGEESRVEGMQGGADDYLVKPFSGRELLARVGAHIELARVRAAASAELETARRRVESALLAGEVGTYYWDILNDRVYGDRNFIQIFRVPMDAGGFAPIADFLAAIHPDDLPIVTEKIRRTLETDSQFRAEYRIRHDDGDVWVIAQGKVERNERHEPIGWSGVILDVTERRRSGERNTSVLKAAMDAIISMDHHGHIIEWNPAAEKTFGYTREEAIGREMAELIIPPGLRSPHRAGLAKYLATGIGPVIGTRLEITAIRRSGEEFPVDLSITRIGDDNPPSFTGFLRDISDRKRSEEAQRLSEARFRTLFESMDEGFCIVEMIYDEKGKPVDYRFLEANPTFDRHTGFQKAVGRTIRELVPDHDEHWFEIYGAVAATGEPKRFVNEAKAMGRWYDVYAFRITGPDGHRVAILFTDITSRKRDEAEREQLLQSERAARGEAERASRMKDDFLATLSHELRTPLNAILGWSQIMETSPTDPETVAEGVSVISRNARLQTQMIEDLLDMSRIISGKLRLDVKRVDVAEVVTAAIESVAPSAAAKSLRIERVLDPIAGPVSGDPSRLQQIVWNLLTNAVKFTPKGGKIQVVVERVNSHVEITVSDTGQGIKPEFLPFVFDRFRQADASTTRRFGGLGLGLSIVKQIVELHGGTVRVKSSGEGKGSSFTVNLPLSIVRLEENWGMAFDQKAPESDPADEVELTGVKVLFVDDDPDARHMGKRILSDRKADVILAASADEALSILQEQRPDVIVSDIGMPDADGYEFIRKVRQLPAHAGRDTPAAALTAFARSEDRRKALGAGYQSHIVKPVEPAELVMVVASLIRRPK